MKTKVYELKRKKSAFFQTKYCGVVVDMPFTIGAGSGGEYRSELVVDDRFTQDAIEHDPRFGKEFFLASTFGEDDPEPEAEPAEEEAEEKPVAKKKAAKKSTKKAAAEEVKEFKTLNDAIYYLEEEKGIDTDVEDIDALLAANNIKVVE